MKQKVGRGATKGMALQELILETITTFFQLRTYGKQLGAVTPWGGGYWGLLRMMKLQGPMTVPQVARMRGHTRQRIQKLADEMVADGVIEFFDNPAHQRSKLMRLTRKGVAVYEQLSARIAALADKLAVEMDESEIQSAVTTLRKLQQKLASQRPA